MQREAALCRRNSVTSVEKAEFIADEMIKMVAELSHNYPNISLEEESEILNVKEQLSALQKKVHSMDFSHSVCVHDPLEALEYLQVVYEIQQLSENIKSLHFCSESDESHVILAHTEDLFDMAMARLEKEFLYLLTHYKQPLEPDRLSFRSTEDDSVEDFSSSSFGEEPIEGKIPQSGISAVSEDFVVDLIQPIALTTLQSIAKIMCLSKYDKECTQAFINARKDAVDEHLKLLQFEDFCIGEVMGINWNTLNSLIKRWNRAMKVFFRVYLTNEKRLSDLVFGAIPNSTADFCFFEISNSSVLQILSFGEAIAAGPPKPEKLFRTIDMYEVLDDLLPDIISLFPSGSYSVILNECHEVLHHLAESVKSTLTEFKYAIQSYTSSKPFSQGGVHPLAKYVMNYMKTLAAYSVTLDSLKGDDERDQHLSSEVDTLRSSSPPFTTTAFYIQSVTAILESNLEVRSRSYKDDSLENIFMMNNICYMVQKVKDSDLRKSLGDNWIRVRNRMFQQHAMNYERSSWSQVLSFLSEEGLAITGCPAKKVIKERFKGFNLSFEEVYRVQTAWLVPNVQLRDDLRISISLKVLQAYRTFVGRYASLLDGVRHRDRYMKYSPDDLEKFLLDLFEGSAKSLQNMHRR